MKDGRVREAKLLGYFFQAKYWIWICLVCRVLSKCFIYEFQFLLSNGGPYFSITLPYRELLGVGAGVCLICGDRQYFVDLCFVGFCF